MGLFSLAIGSVYKGWLELASARLIQRTVFSPGAVGLCARHPERCAKSFFTIQVSRYQATNACNQCYIRTVIVRAL